jgi:hypothetical protein
MKTLVPTAILSSGILIAVLCETALAQTSPAPGADPGEAQVEAVLGPPPAVKRIGPAEYRIDGEDVTLAQLLATMLPEKEHALKAIEDNLSQRLQIQKQAVSGVSLEAKRAQCQALAVNSVDRTRCYQELVALREQQGQIAENSDEERNDEQAQMDKLQRQIEAIDEFIKQYGK